MGYTTLTLGLTLTIPTAGTKNWSSTMLATTWTKISRHGHTGAGDGNQIAAAGIANEAVTSVKLSKNLALFQRVATLTPVADTQTVNFNEGNLQKIDADVATGDITLTLTNPTPGAKYTLLFVQGAIARNLIWPAAVKWPGGQAPILSDVDNAIDKIELYYDGTNYYGEWQITFS